VTVRGFEHVGVVVRDLEATADFFVRLGFTAEAPMRVSGRWVDRVVGLDGVQVDLITVSAPDGSGKLELTRFHAPQAEFELDRHPANVPGYRHIAYRVSDVQAVVRKARDAGYGTKGEIVDYEGIYRLVYVEGPEGLIVEFAEQLRQNE
jgi:catechol 2,3-dioxygenase-like lactoylglutathione lyase family enzyme